MPPQRQVINEFIDLVWEDDKPRIYVAGKPFLFCAFLVANIDTSKLDEINSVDDIAQIPGSHALEGQRVAAAGITPAEQMWGFASSLIGWVESGYNTHAIHSNLAFPLLKELAKAGDIKAKRVLQAELIERLQEGSAVTTTVIIETCKDILGNDAWLAIVPQLRKSIKLQQRTSFELQQTGGSMMLEANLATLVANLDVKLPEEILWMLVRSHVAPLIDAAMQSFFSEEGLHRVQFMQFCLEELAKSPAIYTNAIKSAIYWSLSRSTPILDTIMSNLVSNNDDHRYDELVEAGAHKVGRKLLARILEQALLTRLTKIAYKSPEETRVKILAKVIENDAATFDMLQQIVDNICFMDGGSGIINNAIYANNLYPGLDITPRNRGEATYYEHKVEEESLAGYSIALKRALGETGGRTFAILPSGRMLQDGRTFAHFKERSDLALLGIKPTGDKGFEDYLYYGKVTVVRMDGAAKGFDNWGKRNGWTHCLYADGYPKPRLTDAWFKRGFIYYLDQGTPRNQYYIDKDTNTIIKE